MEQKNPNFPYLVQRFKAMVRHDRKGVDRYFSMDYMGSAEFEFGALPRALKYMRERLDLKELEPVKIQVEKTVAWYVGSPDDLETAQQFFKAALLDKQPPRTKEVTRIAASFNPNETMKSYQMDGWWALDSIPCPWAIFKTKQNAWEWIWGLKDTVPQKGENS